MTIYEKTNIAFLALNVLIGLASFVPELVKYLRTGVHKG